MRGFGHQPRGGDAHRSAPERLGRAGPRNVVALRPRRHPADRRETPHARGGGHRHHLSDARTRGALRGGRTAAQVDHLVRLPGRRDRRRGPRRDRPGVLPGTHPQFAGQLHGVETGVGEAQRTRNLCENPQVHAPGRLHRLPSFGADVHEHKRPFGADSLGFQGGAPRGLRGRPVRHSPRDDPRRRRFDRHSGAHRRRDGTRAGHPGRHAHLLPRGRPAQQRLFAQRHGGGRDRRDGRHERRGLRRHGHPESRSAVARQYVRPRQPHARETALRHPALHQRHGHHEYAATSRSKRWTTPR